MRRFILKVTSLLMVLCCCLGITARAEELTIHDGTSTSPYVPVYGLYVDTQGAHAQFIVLSEDITDLVGATITSLKFYSSQEESVGYSGSWAGNTMAVKMMTTTESSLANSFMDLSAATTVFTGELTVSNYELNVTLSEPFVYGGENLLFDFSVVTSAGYASVPFYGIASGSGRYAGSASGDGTAVYSFSPKITFGYEPGGEVTCAKPTGLAYNPLTLTATTATFSWTAGGEETEWQYLCIPAADAVDWDQSETTDENPLLVEELEPQTDYKFYLRAYCGDEEGQQSHALSVAFTTPCAAISALPKSFDFEAADALACWTVGNLQSTSTSYIPKRSSDAKHNGSYGLELKAYYRITTYSTTSADSAYAALPVIDWGANGIQKHTMSFYAKSVGSSATYNKHLYVYATDNLTSFTLLKDIELTTSFEQYEIDFRNYVGLGRYIVFFATIPESHSSYSTDYYGHFYIDDIEVFETPACLPLKSISISDVERRSFKVTLTPKDGIALGTYDLVCSDVALDNDALEIASKTVVSAASHVVSGLERDTKYYVYVRANCDADGVSTWVCDSARTKNLGVDCDGIEPVTVLTGDGSTVVDYTPWGSYYKRYHTQQIYTASELAAAGLSAGYISKVSFRYALSTSYTKTLTLYCGTTSDNSFAGTTFYELNEVAAAKSVTFASADTWYDFDFDTPFYWDGASNVVIGLLAVGDDYPGSGTKCFYGGTTAVNRAVYSRADSYDPSMTSGTATTNRADIRFTICPLAKACPIVRNLAANILGSGATEEKISWTASAADFLSSYEFILSDTAIVAFSEEELAKKESLAADAVEKDLNGLTPETEYFVYLRAVCKAESHDEGESEWASVNFTTLANCPKVKDLDAALVGLNKVEIFWDVANEEQDTTFYYVLSDVQLDGAGIAAATRIEADSLHVIIDALDYNQDYWAYVASKCGASVSDYDTVHFKTLASCQAVVDLQATRIAHNLVELNWAKAAYATEAQWEVGIIGDESKKQIVSEPKAKIFGLEPETSYEAYVIALCSDLDHSDSTMVSFATAAQPGDCQLVGEGTSNGNMPVTNYDYAYTQMIYDASSIGKGGNITSIELKRSSYAKVMNNMKIYLGITEKSVFAGTSDWIAESDLTLVYDGSFPVGTAEDPHLVLNLIAPFNYNGTDNLVVAVSNGHGNWQNIQNFYYTSVSNTVLYNRNDGDASYAEHPGTTAGNGGLSPYRTNIAFCFEPKTCPDVKALAANDITKESAHISWEPMGNEVQWNVFLSDTLVEDFSAITSTVIGKLDTVFSGLSDDADYYAYVQPVCVGADSWAHKGFRTIASCLAQKDLGIAHEADSITAHTAKLVWTDPNAVRAGDYTVAYGLKDSIDFDKPASYQTLASSDTFALIGNLIPETEYQFAVKANCGGGDESRYSELSAAFKTAIGCFKPSSDPSVPDSTITATTAIVHWADEHDAPAYKVAYGLYDEFDINDESKRIIVDATDTFKLIEGLQPNTRYKVMVKSNCGSYDGESSWTWSEDFYTHCLAAELPFNEGFESAEEFRCWTVGNLQNSSYTYIPYCNSDGKLQLYACKSSGINADSAYAVLPELNFGESALSQYSLALYADAYGAADSYNKHLYVGIVESPNDMSTFVQVGDLQVTTTTKRFEINLSSFSGNGRYIVLLAVVADGTGTRYGRFYIDDVEVFKTPQCYPIKSMSFSDIERRSLKVTISPIDGRDLAADHELVYATSRLDETALESADKVLLHDTNAVAIGSLIRDTKYYVYVRANCGGEDGVSVWIEDSVKTKDLSSCVEEALGTGTASANLVYTSYGNTYSQHIYTAAELQTLGYTAGPLSAVSFQYTGTSSSYDKTQSIYIGATTQSAFAGSGASSFISDVELRYGPTELSYQSGWRKYEFATPFVWDGESNIVVGVLTNSTVSSASGWTAAGTSVEEYRTIYRYQDYTPIDITDLSSVTYGSYATTRPNIRFEYCQSLEACPTVDGLSYELVGDGTSEAIVRWNHPDVDYFGSYDVILSETEITDFSGAVATHSADKDSIKLLGLNASTDYYVYVRTICDGEGHDDGQSSWSDGAHFRTLAACPAPVAPVATLKAADSVFVEWGISFVDQDKAFEYYLSDVELTESQLAALVLMPLNDTLSVGLGNLNPATDYHFYIRSVCGGDYSPFAEAEFSTPVSCQKIVNLHSTNIAHNIIEVAWESAQFATETQWEVGIAGDESKKQIVNERSAKIFGLTPETAYPVYVKAICSATESSEEEIINLATVSDPGACLTIGTGSSAQNDFPLAGWYHYSYTQQLYTAAELGHGAGDILSVAYEYMYSTSTTRNIAIYMANTDATSLSSAYVQDGFVEVLPAQNITFDNSDTWFSIDLTTPFAYTGGNLVVAVLMTKDAAESAYSNNSRFYAASSSGMSRYTKDDTYPIVVTDGATTSSGTAGSSRANMQFCFEDKACPDVTALSAGDVETHSAKISWTPMGSETAWRIILSDTAVVDFDAIAAADIDTAYVLSYAFSGLDADKAYHAYVQPLCGGSDWSHVSFTTMPSCYAPTNLVAELNVAGNIDVTWQAGHGETEFQVVCVRSGEPVWDGVAAVSALAVELDTLTVGEDYTVYVRAYCSATDASQAVSAAFTYDYCKPAPTSVDNNGIIAIAFNDVEQTDAVHPTSAPVYADNTNVIFEVEVGSTAKASITYKTYYSYGTIVWVDLNKNLKFEEFEVVFKGTAPEAGSYSAPESSTIDCEFTVPAIVPTGTYRLRIGGADSFFDSFIGGGAYSDELSCSSGGYRIYEDYTLVIKPASGPGTALDNVSVDADGVQKILLNDHLFIIHEGVWYDAAGRRVEVKR